MACKSLRHAARRVSQPALWVILISCVQEPGSAQQFWNERNPSEWTPAQARLLLSQSPWAKPTKLKVAPLPGEGASQGPPAEPQLSSGSLDAVRNDVDRQVQASLDVVHLLGGTGCTVSLDGSGCSVFPGVGDLFGGDGAHAEKSSGTVGIAEGNVVVLWESAPPIQYAKARLTLKDVVKERSGSSCVVSVLGFPMDFNVGREQTQDNTKTWLLESAELNHKGKDKIGPTDVAVTQMGQLGVIRFFFDRNENMLTSKKVITFRVVLGPHLVQADFNPREMVYRQIPAL